MYLVRIAFFAIVFALVGYFLGWFFADGPRGVGSFFGVCTGILVGAIIGATRSILVDLPDAIERARFVRKIRDLDEPPEQKQPHQ